MAEATPVYGKRGVTTFKFNAADTPEQICLAVLDDVDLHHGESSHYPPWSVLEVVGALRPQKSKQHFAGTVSNESK